ncbi:MAG: helix-turn-helix domain-containing protein [Clostridiales bacterium]|nr:helix-turn-helix domain-containing protein [Candidatus Cacconaster stercorequi]
MSFGDRLQEVRRGSGLTQEQFAEQLKVSRQAVSKWESCRGYPEIEKILYICNRYQVTPNELFADEVPLIGAEQQTEPAEAPKELHGGTLKNALSSFFNNLSPLNKWLGIGILVGTLLLAGIIGLCLKGGSGNMETIIWIGAIIVFGVAEAATAGLVSIWFVLGSVAGLIASICGARIWLQLTLFFVVSIAALLATRPLVKRISKPDAAVTNADRVLGGTARVTEKIDNTVPCGAVYIDGKTWSARSERGTVIKSDTLVRVVRMEGVKLFVEEKE